MRGTGWCGAAFCLALGACGQDASVPTFTADVAPILAQRCAWCHVLDDTGAPYLELDANPYDHIVGVPSNEAPAMPYVTPGDRYASYLWHKVNATQSIAGGAGTSMPVGPRLSDEEVERIGAWIDAGAIP